MTYLLIAFLAFTGCIADGSPELQDANNNWCEYGVFEKVHSTLNEEGTVFRAFLVLNAAGLERWNTSHMAFFETFGPLVARMYFEFGIDAEVQFRAEGSVIGICRPYPELDKVVCELVETSEG